MCSRMAQEIPTRTAQDCSKVIQEGVPMVAQAMFPRRPSRGSRMSQEMFSRRPRRCSKMARCYPPGQPRNYFWVIQEGVPWWPRRCPLGGLGVPRWHRRCPPVSDGMDWIFHLVSNGMDWMFLPGVQWYGQDVSARCSMVLTGCFHPVSWS